MFEDVRLSFYLLTRHLASARSVRTRSASIARRSTVCARSDIRVVPSALVTKSLRNFYVLS